MTDGLTPRKRPRVLCIWPVSADVRATLERGLHGAVELITPGDVDEDRLVALAREGVDAILGWRLTKRVVEAAGDRLRLVLNPGAGVRHLREPLAERDDVTVCNSHGNAQLTAEHTVALILAAIKRIPQHHGYLQAGRWRTGDKEGASGQLRGRTVGLLGLGHVARAVAGMLAGFGVTIVGLRRDTHRREPSMPDAIEDIFGPDELDVFLQRISILVVTLPHTTETEKLIGTGELERLGKSGIVVNVGRGPVIDEDALYEALAAGTIASAAIDVWYDYDPEGDGESEGKGCEPRYPYRRPFHELDQVVLSPHRAASPFARLERWGGIVENLLRFARGEPLTDQVDLRRGY